MTTYKYDQKPPTEISDQGLEAIEKIKESEYSVLVGRNNCGKSYILKLLTETFGNQASYLGPQRYNNFNVLGFYTPNRNRKDEKYRQFIQQWKQETQNFDNSPVNLQQAIAELADDQREILFEIIHKLLGVKLEILHTVENNTMSQKYVSCDDHNISYTSSGLRLITTLVTSLLDLEYDTFLIDEPELGISPEAQGVLADFIFNRDLRKKYFPHIKHLILATHSTIFLDRKNIQNNYSMTKTGNKIDIKSTRTILDFNKIHFFLLGNRLETLYLPSSIIITEGKCDHEYISRILSMKFPELKLSVIQAGSDNRIKDIVSLTSEIFSNLQKSPYRNRIIIVLDQRHGSDIIPTLQKKGIPKENIVVWNKNGIEYYYPKSIIDDIYGAGPELEINDDIVSRNGIDYKKVELCNMVCDKLSMDSELPDEIQEKLLHIVSQQIV